MSQRLGLGDTWIHGGACVRTAVHDIRLAHSTVLNEEPGSGSLRADAALIDTPSSQNLRLTFSIAHLAGTTTFSSRIR